MPFTFNKCTSSSGKIIEGLYEIQPKVFGDNRGYFLESYSEKDFFAAGLTMKFVQDNQSSSTKDVLRGLHFQKQHPQGKLVRAIQGKVYDVAVDLRKGSPTFGCYYGVILDAEKQNQFYIPEGFAHGFYVISETAIFAYKCTDFYHPEDEGGIMWNDPLVNIKWPFEEINTATELDNTTRSAPNLSEKDTKHPSFSFDNNYFDMTGSWQGDK